MSTEAERFAFTDAEWREYQAMPEQGYSHRGKLEFFVNRWLDARGQVTPDYTALHKLFLSFFHDGEIGTYSGHDISPDYCHICKQLPEGVLALFNEKGNE